MEVSSRIKRTVVPSYPTSRGCILDGLDGALGDRSDDVVVKSGKRVDAGREKVLKALEKEPSST